MLSPLTLPGIWRGFGPCIHLPRTPCMHMTSLTCPTPLSQRKILSPPTHGGIRNAPSFIQTFTNHCPRPAHVAQHDSLSNLLSYCYVLGTRDAAGNLTVQGPVSWSLGRQEEHRPDPWVQIPAPVLRRGPALPPSPHPSSIKLANM